MTQTETPGYHESQFAQEEATPTHAEMSMNTMPPSTYTGVVSAPALPMHVSARPDRKLARQADYQVQDMIHRAEITDVALQSTAALVHRVNQAISVAPDGASEYRQILGAFVDGASRRIKSW